MSAQERVAERRRRLLDATLSQWAEAGSKVTMTAVCARAGLTERYFYESFANLDEALRAVLDEIAVEIERCSRRAAERAGPDPAAQVRASVRAFVHLMEEDPRKGRVAIVEAGAMPSLRSRRTELLRQFAHQSALEAAELLGPASPTRGEVAGLLFIGGMAELITAWLDGGVDTDPEQIVDAASRMFFGLYT